MQLQAMHAALSEDAKDPSSAPGQRLREAAIRLRDALEADQKEILQELGLQIDRELYFLQGFLKEQTSEVPDIAAVEELCQQGLQAHAQGWLALYNMAQDGLNWHCQEAIDQANEGDRILQEVEKGLDALRLQFPTIG